MAELSEAAKQSLELANQFLNIENAIVAFSLLQTVALLFAFIKEDRLIASLFRWRPYSSLLTVWAILGYIVGIIVCGILEYRLREKSFQETAKPLADIYALILRGCVVMIVLKCTAIISAGLIYLKIYIQICRERDWHNRNDLAGEDQTPRLKLEHSLPERFIYKIAEIVDNQLFKAKIEEETFPKNFPSISTPIKKDDTV